MLAVVIAVVGSGFAASPAMASRDDCADYPGTICLVQNADWTGQIWRQYPSQVVGCRKLSPEGFNNKATIAVNFTSSSIGLYLYDNDNCTGTKVYVPSGMQCNLPVLGFDNKASSIRIVYF